MPFVVRKTGDRGWCVYTQGADGEPEGEAHGCHATEEMAQRQMRALYANVPEARGGKTSEIVISFGSAAKALPDGKVGGYLIQFGGPDTADCEGEYFTSETDLDTEFPAKASVYYNHGLDPTLGLQRLSRGEMKADEVGVWIETQLDLSDRYQAGIYKLARAGKLGWSSGAVAHLTDPPRRSPGGAIKQWPLKEASLTPHPSDRRNVAVALKGWDPPSLDDLLTSAQPDACPDCGSSRSLVQTHEAVVQAVKDLTADYRTLAKKEGRALSAPRRSRLTSWRDAMRQHADEIDALLSETEPRPRDADAPAPVTGAVVTAEAVEPEAPASLSPLLWLPSADLGWLRESP